MKLYELLEVVNDEVLIKGYDKELNVLFEGVRNDIRKYEEWIITNIKAEQNVIVICVNID